MQNWQHPKTPRRDYIIATALAIGSFLPLLPAVWLGVEYATKPRGPAPRRQEVDGHIPRAQADYIGWWTGRGISLRIEPDAFVHFTRREPNGEPSYVYDRIIRFEGADFITLSHEFRVTRPPRREGDNWVMVIDDVELQRSDSNEPVEVRVAVQCALKESSVGCVVRHTGGAWGAHACFDMFVTCDDGSGVTKNRCVQVDLQGVEALREDVSDFDAAGACSPTGVRVTSVKTAR